MQPVAQGLRRCYMDRGDGDMELLQMRNIRKTFPGVQALKGVSFDLRAGEVHALVGANGAGKSTLMKILSGVYAPSSGEILFNGAKVELADPTSARSAGIATIFQDFELANNLTVAENISLGNLPRRHGRIDWDRTYGRAEEVLERLEVPISPDTIAGQLGVGEQQIIEIARALFQDVHILVMDEPTSSLTTEEVERLFDIIRAITAQGVGVIYISHRLEEIFTIADRISVLRDGELVATYPVDSELDTSVVIEAMLGDNISAIQYQQRDVGNRALLEARELRSKALRHPISFGLKSGEILGVAGLLGSGRSEILKTLFGLCPITGGTLLVDGQEVTIESPQQAMNAGLALVPEDRHREGIFPNLSVKHNIVLAILDRLLKGKLIDPVGEDEVVAKSISQFDIKTPMPETLVSSLSGGNQQKVVLARWCSRRPRVLLLDEPTRGVDVGAKAEIYSIVNGLAEEGLGVMLVSSEVKELLDVCDRILVVCQGQITEEVERKDFDYVSLVSATMGSPDIAQ
jgi:ABC-type sugar transport system ATPase subunit